MDFDDGRHFTNDYDDSKSPEELEAVLTQALQEAQAAVLAAGHSRPSVYVGVAGTAYALLHLLERGRLKLEEALPEAVSRLEKAEAAFRSSESGRATLLEGPVGVEALKAWAALLQGDSEKVASSVRRIGEDFAKTAQELPLSECEILYGRCGFLGAVLLLRQKLRDPTLLSDTAGTVVSEVIQGGLAAAPRSSGSGGPWPLYWEWHGKCYLGGAHGIAGILCTLLQLPRELEAAGPEAKGLVRRTADRLLTCRFRTGNLPSSLGNYKDKNVQWCHGAVGLVPLLIQMASVFEEPSYLLQAKEAADVVWIRGLLSTKGLGLCHGIPGNGYTLLSLYRATGEKCWLHRAQRFALISAQKKEDLTPLADRPYSLFEGLAGAVCFWTDVLHVSSAPHPRDICWPCYEFS